MNYIVEEKRDFKRYRCKTECEIRVGDAVSTGFVVDYSDGLGIITEKAALLEKGVEADIVIAGSDERIRTQVVWVREEGDDMRVGFKRVGNLKGNLKDFKHIDLLMGLQRGTKTGTLEVVSGKVVKKIFIKNGDMIFAASNLIDDRLGERLVKKGRISVEQFNRATQRLLETGEKLGKVLVDMSCMSPHELYQSVREQVVDIILSIFEIEEGCFEFKEGSLEEENLVSLVISAATIIYRGMKRIKSYNYIKQMFPSPDDVLSLSQQPVTLFQSISLDERDEEILHRINGKDTVSTILSLFSDNDFEILKTISAFLSIGIITVQGQEAGFADVSARDILEQQEDALPEEFPAEVDELYTKCEFADYYDFLGLDRNAEDEDIQQAYYSISKRFHPDRHFAVPAYDIKTKLIKIFTYATEAINVLSDPERKAKYDGKSHSTAQNALKEGIQAMSSGRTQPVRADEKGDEIDQMRIGNEQEIEDASVAPYEMGITYMEMGLVEEAIHEFRDALHLSSKKAESCRRLAECYSMQGNTRQAIDEIKNAMKEAASDKEEYLNLKYELAEIYIKNNELKEAATVLEEIQSEAPDFRYIEVKIAMVACMNSTES